MINEYYIISVGDESLLDCDEILTSIKDARYNLDRSKFIVKTKQGIKGCEHLTPYKPYTHKDIKVELSTLEWTNKDI